MRPSFPTARVLALMLAAAFAGAPALAAPPDHAGGGRHDHQHADKEERKADKRAANEEREADRHGRRDDDRHGSRDRRDPRESRDRRDPRPGAYFGDRDRDAVRGYYASAGHGRQGCPPGLARKHNGCLPPGQAKKWQVGHRLPAGVVTHAVPQPILLTLPPAPPRHRYVQVAGDILLIAVGTQLVVDGINGLMR